MTIRPLLAAAGLLWIASAAHADQLIQTPTADLAPGLQGEYLQRVSGRAEGYGTLLVPTGTAYELMFRYYNDLDRSHNIEGGGQFQLLPDGVITPGIALGIWDVTNSGPWHRRAFLVVTKSLRPGQLSIPKPLQRIQLNFGTGTGRLSGIFGSLRLDLPAHFSLVTEYDTRRLNVGVWFTPIRPLVVKAEMQNGIPYLGGELRSRF